MSYSVCLICSRIVKKYEKLCGDCMEWHGRKNQDLDYWRHHFNLDDEDVIREKNRILNEA